MTAPLPSGIDVVEVGPRDGLQNESTLLPTATKVEFIERAIAAGARRIEAVSFVHPRLVPQMADAEDVMAAVPQRDDVSYSGLVLNRRGFDRAQATGLSEINVVVVATDEFSKRNQGVTTEEGLRAWEDIAARAHAAGIRPVATIAVAFGCPFEGPVSSDHVVELARRVADAGPYELALADTIGAGVPTQVGELVSRIREETGARMRCHFHNTRNTGYANAFAAATTGVSTLDASIGGIGGCPFAPNATGNIATEDLEHLLSGMGVRTGLDLEALSRTGTWIGEQLGEEAPALLGKAGPFPQR
ncbi:hydroxymethylglutaryl-CoA lyase [Saccharopolyspora rhizosphaerae]|uniref:Hydroxymethylglutaryl-CoA lyase n=1 Tax=Saccharopolyspora rhizosphaerae TaxID=2492662 RepID=A0A3R8P7V9_9PSEU|nr:hydroxymethylglutaryl-CoA lyase [Saccharopolyspora rhizosphaerae]RRO18294.1 hydroxymethylglutaryl-CoA lyase [Saccharopolyspora rhizosphaerae]